MKYDIESRDGSSYYGAWTAESPAHALAMMHCDAGYDVTVADDGSLIYGPGASRDLCGDVTDWRIAESPR